MISDEDDAPRWTVRKRLIIDYDIEVTAETRSEAIKRANFLAITSGNLIGHATWETEDVWAAPRPGRYCTPQAVNE